MTLPLGYSPSNTPANVNLDVITAEIAALNGAVVNAPINVKNAPYNAKGDGVTDDTTAIQAAITAAAPKNGAVLIPTGRYVVSRVVVIPSGVSVIGSGSESSTIVFVPSASGICFQVSAGASEAVLNRVRGLGFYSTDSTYVKVALELSDVSSCIVDDIYVYGTGTGFVAGPFWSDSSMSSVGIRTRGREASSISNIRCVADFPLYHGANPNTLPTNGEDMDHWNLHNCYLVANGNHCVTWATGIGGSHVSYDGYQAWVGGTGGIIINDTRVAPTIVSRNISIANARGEQSSSSAAYWGDFTFTQPVETLTLRNWLGASTCNGISINGSLQVILDACIMAMGAGTTSLVMAGQQGGSTLSLRACYWQPSSTFTTTGLIAIAVFGFDPSTVAGPTDAFFAGVRVGSYCSFESLRAVCAPTTVGFQVFATGSGDGAVLIPEAAGSGFTLRAENAALGDFTPLQLVGSTLDLRYRTGVGTSASAAFIDTSGALNVRLALAGAGAFGCNAATPQTAAVSGGAMAAYSDGTHGLDTAGHMQALYNLVAAMRAALVANGIMS